MSKDSQGKSRSALPPGANWLALKSTLAAVTDPPKKKRRISTINSLVAASSSVVDKPPSTTNALVAERPTQTGKGADDDVSYLRSMILGHTAVRPSSSSTNLLPDTKIGKYIALDCEMVGVGPPSTDERTGKIITESSLARVSLVNYDGETVMDEFVKQKERVTDYRTHVSGVRPKDLVGPSALSLEDVQKRVAGILKGRILVGHAVFNDLKALLLKHSSVAIRDTQKNPAIRAAYKTSRPGLKTIIQKEFDLNIQGGEHSSIIDARATMALYRLYKNRSEGLPKKTSNEKASDEGGDQDAPSPVRSVRGIDSMPFTETRHMVHSNLESEADSEENSRYHNKQPLPSSEAEDEPPSSSKKRKRMSGTAADPPLVLHVVSDSNQEKHPFANPALSSRSNPAAKSKTSSASTRKISRRIIGGKTSHDSGVERPGRGGKGISSGLSTVVRAHGTKKLTGKGARNGRTSVPGGVVRDDWWSKL